VFHYLLRQFTLFLQPSFLAVLLTLAGLLLLLSRRPLTRRIGWACAIAGPLLLIVGGYSPLASTLLSRLEHRIPPPTEAELAGDLAGIVLLGGFEDSGAETTTGELALNEAAERLTETLRLALRKPELPVVFTGALVSGLSVRESLGPGVRTLLVDFGIDPERVILETEARNTYENAKLTRALLGDRASGRWVLVTSAFHMPRAVGVFRKAGFDVLPYPVDVRTRPDQQRGFIRMSAGLSRLDVAAREWAGLLGYWLMGRTSELLPRK